LSKDKIKLKGLSLVYAKTKKPRRYFLGRICWHSDFPAGNPTEDSKNIL